MKIFILGLIAALLLQTTFLPANLCLVLICSRSLVANSKSTLILSIIFGVLLGILSNSNIGFYALIFLLACKIIEIFKASPLYNNLMLFLPLLFIIYFLTGLISDLVLGVSFSLTQVIFETIFSIPVYFLIKFWEERFVVRPHVKLKFRG